MYRLKYILTLIIPLLFLTSCSQEDDLDEIFNGKTWYMNGGMINGMKLNSEVKTFYSYGNDAYKVYFGAGVFQGSLSKGINFAGTWTANGKKQGITMTFTEKPSTSVPFDKQIANIIANATSYNSGAEFLEIRQDANNSIMLCIDRNKIYN